MPHIPTGNLCVFKLCTCSHLDYQIGLPRSPKAESIKNHKIYMGMKTPAFSAQSNFHQLGVAEMMGIKEQLPNPHRGRGRQTA